MFEYIINTSGYLHFSTESREDREKFKQVHRITTHDVVDCLFVYIKSEHFKIFFHLHRNDDPHAVVKKLLRDIPINEKLDIYIRGGNFTAGFFPWKLNRFDTGRQKEEYQTIHDIHEYLKKNNYPFFSSQIDSDIKVALDLRTQLSTNLYSDNKNSIDFHLYHERMKNFKFNENKFLDENQKVSVRLKNGKDTTSYQNFSTFLYILNSLIVNKNVTINKINHYFNSSGSSVHVNFSKEKTNELIKVVDCDELIESKINIIRIPSINKLLKFNKVWLYCKTKKLDNILSLLKEKKFLDTLEISVKNSDFNLFKDIIEIILNNKSLKFNKKIDEMKLMIEQITLFKADHIQNGIKNLAELIKSLSLTDELTPEFFYCSTNKDHSLGTSAIFSDNVDSNTPSSPKTKSLPVFNLTKPLLENVSGIKRNGIFKDSKHEATLKHLKYNPDIEGNLTTARVSYLAKSGLK